MKNAVKHSTKNIIQNFKNNFIITHTQKETIHQWLMRVLYNK